jgi:hypothetical protein
MTTAVDLFLWGRDFSLEYEGKPQTGLTHYHDFERFGTTARGAN